MIRIEAIEIYHVQMPLIYPWRTAYGEDAAIDSVLVRAAAGDLVGWSESTPFAAPCYSSECAAGVFGVVRDWLAPAVLGKQVESGQHVQQLMAHFKGNPFAKATLDIAYWDLHAKAQGLPLYRALGATRDVVDVGADFGVMDSIDDLVAAVGGAQDAGFKRVKLKFRPGWDVDMLRAVRQEFPQLTIHIDCNSGYELEDTPLFARLDDFSLAMIEQPLQHDDLVDHAALAAQISTPVCLDESITSLHRVRQAIELGSCRWVNIKPGRVGGLTPAVAIHDACREAGIPCWVGGMLESAVGSRVCVALAMLDNFKYPGDIFPSSRFYHEDMSQPQLELESAADGSPQARASDAPGLGAEPVPELLEKFCISHARLEV